jgi:hypothetical protein
MTESPDTVALVPTLRVRVAGDTVTLDFRVANGGGSPVKLTYGTSQRYDFVVVDEAGAEVWRWSAERMFAQAVTEETLAAGAAVEYREVWVAPKRGRYRAVASLVSLDHGIGLETEFEVPAE